MPPKKKSSHCKLPNFNNSVLTDEITDFLLNSSDAEYSDSEASIDASDSNGSESLDPETYVDFYIFTWK